MNKECDNRGIWGKLGAIFKLIFIIFCYASTFLSLAQFGFWLSIDHSFGPIILPTDVITWIQEKWRHDVWWDSVTKGMIVNCGLLLGFYIQHSLMSQRNLEDTSIWMNLHYVYKIDRPLYVFATGVALQGIVRYWKTVPIVVWTISGIKDYYVVAHICAWISLYGTSLMLDLPDMCGFNQVVISSPTVTKKSPDLQLMYRNQRHMGFLPFMCVLLVHPTMTLDRFLLSIFTLIYTVASWRSAGSYEYATKMKQIKKRLL